jgi:hypothetical protein
MKWLAAALALGAVTACSSEDIVFGVPQYSATVPFEVVLKPGEQILVDSMFSIEFDGVKEDSRCPIDAICVWQGNAAVALALTAGDGPTLPFTLNTGIEPDTAVHAGYFVRLLEVSPAPVSTSRIDRRRYRVKLYIERRS